MPVCERHKVETLLSCGRCDKPVCPDCAVYGPAGVRCRDCASFRSSHIYQVERSRLAPAAMVGLVLGSAGSYLLASISVGFLGAFWLSFLLGSFAGEAVLRASGRKRGPVMEAVTGCSIGFGFVLGAALHAMHEAGAAGWVDALLSDPVVLLFGLGISVAVSVSRVRFF